eukprot:11607088-Alexandrium_andersonii.AAC.1
MSASLVGSEMCIRDRVCMVARTPRSRGGLPSRWPAYRPGNSYWDSGTQRFAMVDCREASRPSLNHLPQRRSAWDVSLDV